MDKEGWQKKGEGHRQRLREKFLELGIDSFSDAEVLEMLLTFGTPRIDCKEQARACLAHFKSLPAVLEAPAEELKKIKGIGPKNIFAILFVQGVARRYLKKRLQNREYLSSSREVAAYLVHAMRDLKREVLMAIFLDARHAIIDAEIVAEGTVNSNTVYPRELVKKALDHNAVAMVIAHNHPSGALRPSAPDRALTRTMFMSCSMMNIQLLDHLIIGVAENPEEMFSFADHGLMAEIQSECSQLVSQWQGS